MLADAVRAEGYRLIRNRSGLFWCYFFAPVLALVAGVGATLWMKANNMTPPASGPADVADNLLAAAHQAANPLVLFFIIAGAASLFAADYRWETWRLIRARNTRFNLMLGKLLTFVAAVIAAMLAGLLATIIVTVVSAGVQGSGVTFSPDDGFWGRFGALLLLAFLKLVQVGVLAALVAIVSRSMMAALIAPVFIVMAQAFVAQFMGPALLDPEWRMILLLPGSAFDLLASIVAPSPLPAPALPPETTTKALVTVGLWLIAPFVAAVALFSRQDLSKE